MEELVTFEEFVRDRLASLLRFARVLCGDRGLAEDVVQEVLIRAHRRWDTLRTCDAPEAYVRRMIVNQHLSWRRKWSRQVPVADVRPPGEVPDPSVGHADRQALLADLARLPPRQRATLVLRYYCGLSDPQIAEMLGCRPITVRSHASRALSALRVDAAAGLIFTVED